MADFYGMNELKQAIENECSVSYKYVGTRLKPHHKIINLDKRNGRTTALDYIVEAYNEKEMVDFSGSLDEYIELDFDGSFTNFQEQVTKIRKSCDYSNTFNGVIAIDAAALYQHRQEAQWQNFLTLISKLAKTAILVFFIEENPSKQTKEFVSAIKKTGIRNIDEITLSPYTVDDYFQMIVSYLHESGIRLRITREDLEELISKREVKKVDDALDLAEEMAEYVDFSVDPPVLNKDAFMKMGGNE